MSSVVLLPDRQILAKVADVRARSRCAHTCRFLGARLCRKPLRMLGGDTAFSRPRTHDGSGLVMLAHVTFHNSNSTSAIEWVNYNSVLATLEEMETGYTAFQRIDVTVDSNPTNAFVRPLRRWAVERQLRRVRLRVSLHARLPHPFRLAWAHREHMERAVLSGRYDWFLYTEADVFVPSLAMRVQVQLALKLYAQTQLLLGFARVSNDTQNRPNPSPKP